MDKTAQVVKERVEAKGWQSVEHYWKAESSCTSDFGVRGIPHCVLVNKSGKMVWKGHPGNVNIEQKITELANE